MIFGIGLSKTGTTSLHRAMGQLGMSSLHYPPAAPMLAGNYAVLADYHAASDITVSMCFEQLDRAYPGSRFIYTTRPMRPWLSSCAANFPEGLMVERYTGTPEEEVFNRVYGVRWFQEAAFVEAYRRHEERVRSYFLDRSDLLTIDITNEPRWSRLCEFLGVPEPTADFPHFNRTSRA